VFDELGELLWSACQERRALPPKITPSGEANAPLGLNAARATQQELVIRTSD